MAIINTPATGHGNRSETYSSGMTIDFKVFLNSTPKEAARLSKVKQAYAIVDRLDKKINLYGPCNKYFKSLPKTSVISGVIKQFLSTFLRQPYRVSLLPRIAMIRTYESQHGAWIHIING